MSEQKPPSHDPVEVALRATRAYVRKFPKHARWIIEGHPPLTHQEHYDRFGKVYKKGDLS